MEMAEAQAKIEAMDSVSRAGPNLHYHEDWTYHEDDSPVKRMISQDHTGE